MSEKRIVEREDQIWNRDDVADYLRYANKSLDNYVFNQPDFPPQINLGKGRYWAKDVIAWVKRKGRKSL